VVWNFTTEGEVASSPAIAGGNLYVGSGDNKVYALNAQDGSLVWSFATGGDVASSPAVADDVVFVGSYDGKVYALDATEGACIWSYATGDMVVSSPAIAEGVVYVGSYDHLVYAFGPDKEKTETTPATIPLELIVTIVLAASLAVGLLVLFYRRKRGR